MVRVSPCSALIKQSASSRSCRGHGDPQSDLSRDRRAVAWQFALECLIRDRIRLSRPCRKTRASIRTQQSQSRNKSGKLSRNSVMRCKSVNVEMYLNPLFTYIGGAPTQGSNRRGKQGVESMSVFSATHVALSITTPRSSIRDRATAYCFCLIRLTRVENSEKRIILIMVVLRSAQPFRYLLDLRSPLHPVHFLF
jgi:hypothetical protein